MFARRVATLNPTARPTCTRASRTRTTTETCGGMQSLKELMYIAIENRHSGERERGEPEHARFAMASTEPGAAQILQRRNRMDTS